jgi:type I restriction-modification system DNA methylase subunit
MGRQFKKQFLTDIRAFLIEDYIENIIELGISKFMKYEGERMDVFILYSDNISLYLQPLAVANCDFN